MLTCKICQTDNAPLIYIDGVGFVCDDCDERIRNDLKELYRFYFATCSKINPLINWKGLNRYYER